MYDGKYILVMNNNVGKLSNFHIATKSVKNTFQAVKDQSSYNGESENVPKKKVKLAYCGTHSLTYNGAANEVHSGKIYKLRSV